MRVSGFRVGLAGLCLVLSLPASATNYTVFPDGSGCSLPNAMKAVNFRQALVDDGAGGTQWITPDPNHPPAAEDVICAAGSGIDTISLIALDPTPGDWSYYSVYKLDDFPADAARQAVIDWLSAFSDQTAYLASATYQLAQQVEVGSVQPVNLTVQLYRKVFDKAIYPNAVIKAPAGDRVFFVHAGSSLTLKGITLEGADVTAQPPNLTPAPPTGPEDVTAVPPTSPNGGVIYAQGSVNLAEGSLVSGGTAVDGGGIYFDGTNLAFNFTNAFVNDNTATGNGGGIGMGNTTTITIVGNRFNIFGNTAAGNGGGIYVGGRVADIKLTAGTFYQNAATGTGAAIDFETGHDADSVRASTLNNLTFVGNTGGATLHYADLCQQDDGATPPACTLRAPPGAATDTDSDNVDDTWVVNPDLRLDKLWNSVLVGNDAGCSLTPDFVNTSVLAYAGPGTFNQYLENAYAVVQAGSGCPDAEQALVPGNAAATPSVAGDPVNNATAAVLAGVDGSGAKCLMSAAGCGPRDLGRNYYHLRGFLPADFTGSYPTLVNAASRDDQTTDWLCAGTDQRGLSRDDSCDVGALELRIAKGATDNLNKIVSGRPVWLDVVKNDLGDMSIDCGAVAPAPCLDFVRTSPFNTSLQVVYAAGPLADGADGNPVFSTTTDPGTVTIAGAAHPYPLVRYSAPGGLHATDSFLYQVSLAALSGASYAGLPPRAQASLMVAPPDTFTSATIKDYKSGGISMLWLFGLALLGGLRRLAGVRRWLLAGVGLLLLGTTAQADITVNDLGDPLLSEMTQYHPVNNSTGVLNDGKCTLREALQRSFDDYPVPNSDCAAGAHGTDTIILPGPNTHGPGSLAHVTGCTTTECTITLRSPLAISRFNSVVLQGQGVGKTVIDGAGQFRISTESPLTLRYLDFRNGAALGAGQAGQGGAVFTNSDLMLDHVAVTGNTATEGGAIFLNYGDNQRHVLSIASSYLANNTATTNGGAISTVGQTQKLALAISSSTLEGNTAGSKGGGIHAPLASSSSLSVVNSILAGNSAGPLPAGGGSAINLASASPATKVYLLNNTFYNNAGAGFLDTGTNGNVILSNSVVAGTDVGCSSGTGVLGGDHHNLFTAAAEPPSCGSSATAMTATLADITTALDGGTLTPTDTSCDLADPDPDLAAACKLKVTSGWLPPLYQVPQTDTFLVDKGNPAGHASDTVSPESCRTTDMRGKSRSVGTQCDLGAYEVQFMTANDDAASTSASNDSGTPLTSRQARADVLRNDLPSDGNTLVLDKIRLPRVGGGPDIELAGGGLLTTSLGMVAGITPAGVEGTLKWVKMEAEDPDCAANDTCGLLFEMSQSDQLAMLSYANGLPAGPARDDLVGLATCPVASTPAIDIPYIAEDDAGLSASGELSITLRNIPPQFPQSTITVWAKPDESVRIPIQITDPDAVDTTLPDGRVWNSASDGGLWLQTRDAPAQADPAEAASWETISIPRNGDPHFAEQSGLLNPGNPDFHPAWGYGVKWNGDPVNPVITYTRADKTQVFNDSFQIQVRDRCGATSTLTINVKFPQKETAGGDLLKGGSFGLGIMLLFGFGFLRRRRS